jgi:tetratricopeptide (TPR) repeat protein
MRSSLSTMPWGVAKSISWRSSSPIWISVLLLAAIPSLYAQNSEQLAVAPPQIHRAEPPSPSASAKELERTGDALQADKNFLDALDYYKAALAKDPHNAVLLNKIGISDLQLHHYLDARKNFERSIHADKTYANAYANLGVVFYEQGNCPKSIHYYDKAIQLDKDEAVFYNNRAASLFIRKEFEKASADYAKAFALDPDIFERSERGGGVQARLPSPQDRARYDYVLAKLYAKNGMPERSLHYLRKAMEDGYRDIKNVYKDQEFTELRKDPRFVELMASKPLSIPE